MTVYGWLAVAYSNEHESGICSLFNALYATDSAIHYIVHLFHLFALV